MRAADSRSRGAAMETAPRGRAPPRNSGAAMQRTPGSLSSRSRAYPSARMLVISRASAAGEVIDRGVRVASEPRSSIHARMASSVGYVHARSALPTPVQCAGFRPPMRELRRIGCGRLELVQVHDVAAVEHAQVHRLVHLAVQALEDRAHGHAQVHALVELEGDAEELGTDHVPAVVLLGGEPPLAERRRGSGARSSSGGRPRRRPPRASRPTRARPSTCSRRSARSTLSMAGTSPMHGRYRIPPTEIQFCSTTRGRRPGRDAGYARMPSGMRSPCAAISSSHIAWMSSSDRVAPAFGSSIAAW